MHVQSLSLAALHAAPWNPNTMAPAMTAHLRASLDRFGPVVPLVVRVDAPGYEVLGGNQRLAIFEQQSVDPVPCVVVEADDAEARLLAQALNAIHGQDDWNAKAALVRDLVAALPEAEILRLLPETPEALHGWAHLGDQSAESLAQALGAWNHAKAARLERLSFPLTADQKSVLEAALAQMLPGLPPTEAPNRRAIALVTICQQWLTDHGSV